MCDSNTFNTFGDFISIHLQSDMLTTLISDRSPAYRITIKISRYVDIATKIKKFLPILRFGLGGAIFVNTMLHDSDTIQFAKKSHKSLTVTNIN